MALAALFARERSQEGRAYGLFWHPSWSSLSEVANGHLHEIVSAICAGCVFETCMRPFHDTRYSGALGWANRSVLRRSRFRRRFRFCVAIDSDKAKAATPTAPCRPTCARAGRPDFPDVGNLRALANSRFRRSCRRHGSLSSSTNPRSWPPALVVWVRRVLVWVLPARPPG